MILSQIKIFNIFPSTTQLANILKILTNICDRETLNYIPAIDLWINRLYFSLSNQSKYSCLTIDCRNAGPVKYRTNADNNFEQFCYYGQNKKDRLFNKLLAKRVLKHDDSLVFEICSVINTTKNDETKVYKAVQELQSLVKMRNGKDRSIGCKQYPERTQLTNRENLRGRPKDGRRPRFLS